jgi:hypothetical protein
MQDGPQELMGETRMSELSSQPVSYPAEVHGDPPPPGELESPEVVQGRFAQNPSKQQ